MFQGRTFSDKEDQGGENSALPEVFEGLESTFCIRIAQLESGGKVS